MTVNAIDSKWRKSSRRNMEWLWGLHCRVQEIIETALNHRRESSGKIKKSMRWWLRISGHLPWVTHYKCNLCDNACCLVNWSSQEAQERVEDILVEDKRKSGQGGKKCGSVEEVCACRESLVDWRLLTPFHHQDPTMQCGVLDHTWAKWKSGKMHTLEYFESSSAVKEGYEGIIVC